MQIQKLVAIAQSVIFRMKLDNGNVSIVQPAHQVLKLLLQVLSVHMYVSFVLKVDTKTKMENHPVKIVILGNTINRLASHRPRLVLIALKVNFKIHKEHSSVLIVVLEVGVHKLVQDLSLRVTHAQKGGSVHPLVHHLKVPVLNAKLEDTVLLKVPIMLLLVFLVIKACIVLLKVRPKKQIANGVKLTIIQKRLVHLVNLCAKNV